ncbi:Ig-like domain-containing protein [Catenulispora pinisilvae]|uniref:Ig-like domain-containing protein n=1 Tax=Catenulispora pinisilvae TaxID=2705253 RepID=UPI0018928731|nr:Ig-like domain-containing protein [Catenulispora pinisilvae]
MSGLNRRAFIKIGGAAAPGAVLLGAGRAEAAAAPAKPGPRPAPEPLAGGAGTPGTARRKFVEYGWDVPGPVYLRDHIQAMEQMPLDGVAFNLYENPALSGGTGATKLVNPLDPTPLTAAGIQLDVLSAIGWQTFTDNFLVLTAGRPPATPMNWFDDTQWTTIQSNLGLLGQAVQASGAVGVFLDPENSAGNVAWQYNATLFPNNTFEQAQAQVRMRGGQFMSALQAARPDIKVLILHMSVLLRYLTPQYQAFLGGQLSSNPYALFLSFVDGMLDARGPQATIHDGSETDYWFDESTLWVYDAQYQRGGWFAVSPENRCKWAENVLASTVYLDLTLGHATPNIAAIYGCYKTYAPSDFQQWYEHNLYHAALKSSEYVWLYSEKMSWWSGTAFAGAADGVRAVQAKLQQGEALGYDMSKYLSYPDHRDTAATFTTSPSLVLSGPANGAQVAAGSAVVVTAVASDPASVERVEFYHNGQRIDYSTTPPNIAAVYAEPGPHTLLARAFLAAGGHVTSNPIIIQAA